MNFKFLYIIPFLICQSLLVKGIDTLLLENNYKQYRFENTLTHFIDSSNTLPFSSIQNKDFEQFKLPDFLPIQYTYWTAFYLENEAAIDYEIHYMTSDSVTFYIPNKDGKYIKKQRGTYTKEEAELTFPVYLYLTTDTLDLTKPIYVRVRNFSKWGANLDYDQLIAFRKMPKDTAVLRKSDDEAVKNIFMVFLGISGFLFIYFFIQFLINKRLSFLIYSLYLVTLFIYFFNRLYAMFFWTMFNEPTMMGLVNENSQILSGITYLVFMNYFLNVKERYPKFYKYLIGGIGLLTLIMLIYSCLYYFMPFNPIHLIMMPIFRLVSAIISIWFIFVVVRNQPKTLEWIAVGSGVILMFASIVPSLLGNFVYAMIFFIAEILVLAIGLAYQVREGDLERIKTKENLIEQLKLNATIQQEMQQKLETEVKVQTEKAIQKTQEAEQAKAEQLKSTFQSELERIKMKALQAQMNPHFLFNCLNSIRLFYLKNETKKADAYITKFSRLLRLMLNNSRSDLISLQEELDALKLYVEFEQMRFKNKFDFELHIDNQVSTTDFKIQPLTIQPFVENAIWHGLMQNDQTGKLKIDVQKNAQKTIISVEDNGIGRVKARQIKAGQNQIHQSHGLTITKERMDLMKKSLNREAAFQIIDLMNDNSEAIGTRVEIIYS